jgi:hypothetical protein
MQSKQLTTMAGLKAEYFLFGEFVAVNPLLELAMTLFPVV